MNEVYNVPIREYNNESYYVICITTESMSLIKISVIIVTDLPVRRRFAKNTSRGQCTCAFVHVRSVLALGLFSTVYVCSRVLGCVLVNAIRVGVCRKKYECVCR